ncbi:hypothetical protein [Sphingobacterium sp. MYb388]|uniref:hypothetical protein n=1 Tax=Sphingobacterium sp. MYb388 TaxID=2745437 RepID=UPI0030A55378
MKAIILDIFQENSGSVCYLSKSTLKEYITSLSIDYNQYDVQREIVGHVYLDNLVHSLLEGKHIPPIVLIDVNEANSKVGDERILTDFKILDGLQRTYRLKYLYDTIQFFLTKNFETDFSEKTRLQLSKEFKNELFEINSNVNILTKLIDYAKLNPKFREDFSHIFERNQWFEIWLHLEPQEEVNKMLILNAGHKAVSNKHQIELLFNYALPTLKKIAGNNDLSIVREKEKNSIRFSKERERSQFHLSHMIMGLISYYEGKIFVSNAELIQKQQSNSDYAQEEVFLNSELLKLYLNALVELDKELINQFPDQGIKWLGREISYVGMFGALGKYRLKHRLDHKKTFEIFSISIIHNTTILNLQGFENERNSQALSKINIGSVNKKAVFEATLEILENGTHSPLNWENYFKGGGRDDN